MQINTKLGFRVLSVFFLVMAALFFSQRVLALSFDLADHPGMCFQKVSLSGGVASILLYPCSNPDTYTLNDNSLTAIIIKSTCNYTYNCGSCVSGLKSCSVSSVVPTGYTCDNQPVTQQTCTASLLCTSHDYSGWSGCKADGTQTRTVTASIPAGCDSNATGAAPLLLSKTCTVCAYTCATWSACVSGMKNRTCTTAPTDCVAPDDVTIIPKTQEACTPNYCTYSYGEWGVCTTSGQIRTYTKTPTGCYDDPNTPPVIWQACTYVPPVVACTSYDYSIWGTCSSGTQVRTIASQSPAGCTGTSSAILLQPCYICGYSYGSWSACTTSGQTRTYAKTPTGCYDDPNTPPVIWQACTYVPPVVACTSYDYSIWGTCSSGTQVRTIVNKYPSGCNDDGTAEKLTQACTYDGNIPCTGYTYYPWGACKSTGKQERAIKTSTPENCTLTSSLSADQDTSRSCAVCVYSCGSWTGCNNGIKTRVCSTSPSNCVLPYDTSTIPSIQETCAEIPATCAYSYGAWGACSAAGKQARAVVKSPAGCVDSSNAPLLEQSCVPTSVACAYQVAGWGSCSSAGFRTRTVTASPSGCKATTAAPVAQETCPACAYTYGEWKNCVLGGKQTRDFKQSPEVCYQKEKPIIEKTCVYSTPVCVYNYSGWSVCGADGIQTRTYAKTPEGCTESAASEPVLKQTCVSGTAGTCTYAYNDWGACGADGKQTRSVVSKTPSGCKEGTLLLEQNCVLKSEPADPEKFVPSCDYSYSSWSDCVEGSQSRIVTAKQPVDCRERANPSLIQACKTAAVVKIHSSDAPKREPASVLTEEPVKNPNPNGKTSPSWQKYYFGSEACGNADVCGGLADPDNDGLVNNEEFRFGTDPNYADTDNDGHVDAEEIQAGTDPLVKPSEEKSDEVAFEDAQAAGEVNDELLAVSDVEMIMADYAGKKNLKITGKGLPNTYVTIYIYSVPIVLSVKTDSDGNWSYVLEDPMDEGTHEVYVAVTDNAGKITAKSSPLTFVQTAEAASVIPSNNKSLLAERTAAPSKTRLLESYYIFGAAGLGGLLLALAAIGMLKGKKSDN